MVGFQETEGVLFGDDSPVERSEKYRWGYVYTFVCSLYWVKHTHTTKNIYTVVRQI